VALALACAAVLAVAAPPAHAISGSVAPVSISPAALAADPALASFKTWDLRVHVGPGERWSATGFEATLTRGALYNPPGSSNFPQASLWTALPNLRYDTFLTQPADPNDDASFTQPNLFGRFDDPTQPATFGDTHMSVTYAFRPGFANFGQGDYTVARLTLSNDATGSLVGKMYALEGATVPFSFVLPLPEPTTGVLLVATLGLLARRARRRARQDADAQ
jgi:hypothetical protein